MIKTRHIEPNLFGVSVQQNSVYCGVSLTSIQLPEHCALLGILRDNQIILINESPENYAEDYILAISIHPMMTPALKVLLKKTHPIYYSMNDCSTNILRSRDGFCGF